MKGHGNSLRIPGGNKGQVQFSPELVMRRTTVIVESIPASCNFNSVIPNPVFNGTKFVMVLLKVLI